LELSVRLGGLETAVQAAAERGRSEKIAERIWNRDFTVWKSEDVEIGNRLGWLDCPDTSGSTLTEVDRVVSATRSSGYRRMLLLGMGGSSLAPELFSATFGASPGSATLEVLDSTHPDAIKTCLDGLDIGSTLFVVSTKSGGTVETLSLLKFFFACVAATGGISRAGDQFIAITDPGSGLEQLASKLSFRHTFLNDPKIGGRYSVLSLFGLVPARLMGIDVDQILARARAAADGSRTDAEDSGFRLGVALGTGALHGRDKVTLATTPSLAPFGAWMEQLIAESTGKEGRGILPIVGEELGTPEEYGDDRLFLYLHLRGESMMDSKIGELAEAGHPVLELEFADLYDLGAAFFACEFATAVAGAYMGINPFDQPDVEAAKQIAREMVAAYLESGELPRDEPTFVDGEIQVFGGSRSASAAAALTEFLENRSHKSAPYLAVHAYLEPDPETDRQLRALQMRLRSMTRMAITVGYGPRFLHSTGQLHKGDGGNGLFLQLTGDPREEVGIPDEPGGTQSNMGFGTLIEAQGMGDRRALSEAGRAVLRLHLGKRVHQALSEVIGALSA
jgi:glucose-6-phosphate isomerase